ncbi:MAG: alpha-E domain-containing protein [Verrucomicrobia bacterium]|nr:alpha-E domain-containing protein [Kiritimatiellia bacterium]MCP5487936.1 alpha-E domain-containing protein [Verrucomicrobiota bacterium]
MLSRVADAIYWMNRYMERAENTSRFIGVTLNLMLEQQDNQFNQWGSLVQVTGDYDLFVKRHGNDTSMEKVVDFLTFDLTYPSSIYSCVRAARENARSIRESISSPMWEYINRLYIKVSEQARHGTPAVLDAQSFFTDVLLAGSLFNGITDNTMSHNEAWNFSLLGRMLERADKTSRMLDVKYFILLPSLQDVGTPYDELQWIALLSSASAYEMYRKRYGRIDPRNIVGFLVLDPGFPRTMLHSVTQAEISLHQISGTPLGTYSNLAEQRLGQLRSELAFSSADDIISRGLHEFIDSFQNKVNDVDEAIFKTFFELRPMPSGE